MKDDFRPIPGFPNYEVNSEGKVKSLPRKAYLFGTELRKTKGRILKETPYGRVSLIRNSVLYTPKVKDLVEQVFGK